MFGSSKPSGLIVSGRPWSGATVWPTSSSQTTRELLAEAVLLQRLQPDDVRQARLGLVRRAARQALRPDVGDGPGRAADVDDLALLREREERARGEPPRSVRKNALQSLSTGSSPTPSTMSALSADHHGPVLRFAQIASRLSLMEGIPDRVLSLIEASGQSRRAFAQDIGLDDSKLSKSLSGARRFSSLDLARIADKCGVTVDWLVTGEEPALAIAARTTSGQARTALEAAKRYSVMREDLAGVRLGAAVAAPGASRSRAGRTPSRAARSRPRRWHESPRRGCP